MSKLSDMPAPLPEMTEIDKGKIAMFKKKRCATVSTKSRKMSGAAKMTFNCNYESNEIGFCNMETQNSPYDKTLRCKSK
jgi:hypothetical protein